MNNGFICSYDFLLQEIQSHIYCISFALLLNLLYFILYHFIIFKLFFFDCTLTF